MYRGTRWRNIIRSSKFKIAFPESDNPVAVWELIFCKYEEHLTTNEVYYEVGIYAEDGSIWGVDASIPKG